MSAQRTCKRPPAEQLLKAFGAQKSVALPPPLPRPLLLPLPPRPLADYSSFGGRERTVADVILIQRADPGTRQWLNTLLRFFFCARFFDVFFDV